MNECVLRRRPMSVKCVAHTEQTLNIFTAAKSQGERSFIPFDVKGWGWNCRDSALQSSKGRCQSQMRVRHVLAPMGGKSHQLDLQWISFEPSDCASAERGEEGKTVRTDWSGGIISETRTKALNIFCRIQCCWNYSMKVIQLPMTPLKSNLIYFFSSFVP